MMNYLTSLKIADNSGVSEVQCMKMLTGSFVKQGNLDNLLVVVMKKVDSVRSKMQKGLICSAVVVSSASMFFSGCGIWIKFNQNAVVLLNKSNAPYAKRLSGPMLKETCVSYNFIGTVTSFMI